MRERAPPSRDEITGVRGSTRLEAKKQRRREGREQVAASRSSPRPSSSPGARPSSGSWLVRQTGGRTQIGVLEDDVLVEHYVSRDAGASMAGNVYLGRVQNVLPSMEAAFVDIGKGRNAVLYAGEVNWDAAGLEGQAKRIENVLKSGEAVLVQVTKDPLGHKGARLTSQISLPGRYLVYVPNGSMTGISRKLPEKERARLKQILKAVLPEDAGVIVRTAAEGASEDELRATSSGSAAVGDDPEAAGRQRAGPPARRAGPDHPGHPRRLQRGLRRARRLRRRGLADRRGLRRAGGARPARAGLAVDRRGRLFSRYRIDEQLAKALDRKVWLPSGGSLVIDRTEAMTVVDVNTGKFTGSGGNLEETVTKNNLEAAEEIVRQLRLRDVGGIIVIDFIDMVLESNRELVLRRLLECLGRDRTKHQVAEVTSLGLVQMTRKRVGQGLLEVFSETCEVCHGRGVIVHNEPVERKSPSARAGRPEGKGGGRGNGGKGRNGGQAKAAESPHRAQREQQRRASAEAQKMHEAARKAMERAGRRRPRSPTPRWRSRRPPPAHRRTRSPSRPARAARRAGAAPARAGAWWPRRSPWSSRRRRSSRGRPSSPSPAAASSSPPTPPGRRTAPAKRRRRRATSPADRPVPDAGVGATPEPAGPRVPVSGGARAPARFDRGAPIRTLAAARLRSRRVSPAACAPAAPDPTTRKRAPRVRDRPRRRPSGEGRRRRRPGHRQGPRPGG